MVQTLSAQTLKTPAPTLRGQAQTPLPSCSCASPFLLHLAHHVDSTVQSLALEGGVQVEEQVLGLPTVGHHLCHVGPRLAGTYPRNPRYPGVLA